MDCLICFKNQNALTDTNAWVCIKFFTTPFLLTSYIPSLSQVV